MSSLRQLADAFAPPLLPESGPPGDHIGNPAALPDQSLAFIISAAKVIGAKRAVEFGSGRSTVAFLDGGLTLTSIEDSQIWLADTERAINRGHKENWSAIVRPLSTKWEGFVPFRDWTFDQDIAEQLEIADLILIDSPNFVPFRERTLINVLRHARHALVILDDSCNPTVQRFCNRIAQQNPGLLHRRVRVGHGFDLFCHRNPAYIRSKRGPIETAKAWRRFWMAYQKS
jgi:hypothetical protein